MILHWVCKISEIFVSNYLFAETYIWKTNLIPYVCNHRYEVFIRTFWSVNSKWSADVSICTWLRTKAFCGRVCIRNVCQEILSISPKCHQVLIQLSRVVKKILTEVCLAKLYSGFNWGIFIVFSLKIATKLISRITQQNIFCSGKVPLIRKKRFPDYIFKEIWYNKNLPIKFL